MITISVDDCIYFINRITSMHSIMQASEHIGKSSASLRSD